MGIRAALAALAVLSMSCARTEPNEARLGTPVEASWRNCFGYDGEAFDTPANPSLPEATECSATVYRLQRSSPTLGVLAELTVASARLEDIPAAWRQDRPIGNGGWVADAETQIAYAGHLEVRFLDEHGFVVAETESDEQMIRSGQATTFRVTHSFSAAEDVSAVRSAEAYVSLTHCYTCEPPPR